MPTNLYDYWECQNCGSVNVQSPQPVQQPVKKDVTCDECGQVHKFRKEAGETGGRVKQKKFRLPFLN